MELGMWYFFLQIFLSFRILLLLLQQCNRLLEEAILFKDNVTIIKNMS